MHICIPLLVCGVLMLLSHVLLTLRWALRDRLMIAVLAVALLLLLLVPAFSLFSMRQVQGLGITLGLSSISLVLLVLVLLLGASSIWRDVERHYTASVLTLPLSRTSYVLGKFFGLGLFLLLCTLVLGLVVALVIKLAALQYPSDLPIAWGNIVAAMAMDFCKSILLLAVALLFSSLSTSFFLPFFATLSVYLVGSASQEAMEYLSRPDLEGISPLFQGLVKCLYYVIPNLSGFNLKIHAIYALDLPVQGLWLTLAYFVSYTAILLFVSVWIFNRRQLP